MKCIINGDEFNFEQDLPVTEVLSSLELDQERIIVEFNGSLIKKENFNETIVRESDQLELLEFVGGG
ncbi:MULTISPECIES: sulfur carrier protein ThiS [Mammaliicoccus]|jgi:sulfur carrier protein|uniref:Sulfur carrier protein ThiS n=1 Tax=Mammaliicoccus lentus TaxID=42858 RepID=A0AAX3W302_MAMLE|nr:MULTISPECIES: sulfur carrier protein ThiS [Mammaliicoccus]HBV02831.1 thiamine biosynthesis protein ThiS [Staphylococcus sp.]MBF0749563.1 sulfur carrier protein ThiS [Mammaliicoccus lentus]MBF0794901.1 sulfur carrier protein ThiS [Mammaliicoccus lentus]MBU6114219.1 sulfur carrier protein ThiS [Mammaliicoccus lentus]MBW0767550.1 sulfur carrier protein ThiS [Mammaliicoccus lentus]